MGDPRVNAGMGGHGVSKGQGHRKAWGMWGVQGTQGDLGDRGVWETPGYGWGLWGLQVSGRNMGDVGGREDSRA